MKTGSFAALAAFYAGVVNAMTPAGVFPVNTENMTNFYDTSTLATNGANIAKANVSLAPTVALDAQLTGKTFAIVMFDPDTPATGIGGNGTNSFLHWFQDGLTSDVASLVVGGNSTNAKTVFPLKNVGNINAIQPYVAPGPPTGQTHRYTQILIDTTNVTGFVVSSATGNATATRSGFDMAKFVKESNLTVFSSNFFNVTGV